MGKHACLPMAIGSPLMCSALRLHARQGDKSLPVSESELPQHPARPSGHDGYTDLRTLPAACNGSHSIATTAICRWISHVSPTLPVFGGAAGLLVASIVRSGRQTWPTEQQQPWRSGRPAHAVQGARPVHQARLSLHRLPADLRPLWQPLQAKKYRFARDCLLLPSLAD